MAVSHIASGRCRTRGPDHVSHQPRRVREFGIAAGRPPSRHSRRAPGRGAPRPRRQHAAQRDGDVDRYRPLGSSGSPRPSGAAPGRIQPRSGSTGPPMHSGISLPRTTGGSSLTMIARRAVGRPVEDEAERPFGPEVAQQHDRPREVGSWSWGIERAASGRTRSWSATPVPVARRASDLGGSDPQIGDERAIASAPAVVVSVRGARTTGERWRSRAAPARSRTNRPRLGGNLELPPEQRLRRDRAEAYAGRAA